MKMTIRPMVFETNSSATHSLVHVSVAAQKAYLAERYGEKKAAEYETLFPTDDDWYTADDVITDLISLGAVWDGSHMDLTTIPDEVFEQFGYPREDDRGYKIGPGMKFLLVVALRDSLYTHRHSYSFDDDDELGLKELCESFGIKSIEIPDLLYGVNHQCCDDIREQIEEYGVLPTICQKNIVLLIDHD